MSNIVMGSIIVLLLRGDNFDKAVEIISSLVHSPHLIKDSHTITTEHINEIFELCLAQAYVPAIFVSGHVFYIKHQLIYYNVVAFAFRHS